MPALRTLVPNMGDAQWTVVRSNPDSPEEVCCASGVSQTSAMKEIWLVEVLERVQFNHSSVEPWHDTL